MENLVKTLEPWKILKREEEMLNKNKLEALVRAATLVSDVSSFYIMDYFREQIIVDADNAWILGGYSRAIADRKGFKFLNRLFSKKQLDWLARVNLASYNVFFNMPVEERNNLELSHDLTIHFKDNKRLVFNHKTTPFKLCENGNLWLGLCRITPACKSENSYTATIRNTKTGQKYDFINNEFVLREEEPITTLEAIVMTLILKGMTDFDICAQIKQSSNQLNILKNRLYKKLAKKIAVSIPQVVYADENESDSSEFED